MERAASNCLTNSDMGHGWPDRYFGPTSTAKGNKDPVPHDMVIGDINTLRMQRKGLPEILFATCACHSGMMHDSTLYLETKFPILTVKGDAKQNAAQYVGQGQFQLDLLTEMLTRRFMITATPTKWCTKHPLWAPSWLLAIVGESKQMKGAPENDPKTFEPREAMFQTWRAKLGTDVVPLLEHMMKDGRMGDFIIDPLQLTESDEVYQSADGGKNTWGLQFATPQPIDWDTWHIQPAMLLVHFGNCKCSQVDTMFKFRYSHPGLNWLEKSMPLPLYANIFGAAKDPFHVRLDTSGGKKGAKRTDDGFLFESKDGSIEFGDGWTWVTVEYPFPKDDKLILFLHFPIESILKIASNSLPPTNSLPPKRRIAAAFSFDHSSWRKIFTVFLLIVSVFSISLVFKRRYSPDLDSQPLLV